MRSSRICRPRSCYSRKTLGVSRGSLDLRRWSLVGVLAWLPQAMVKEEFPVGPPGSESESDADLQEHVAAALLAMFHTVKTTFRESFFDLSRGLSTLAGGLTLGTEDGAGALKEGGEGGAGEGVSNGVLGAGGAGGLAEGGGGGYSMVGIQAGAPAASLEQKILMVMSNAAFSRSFLARELADKYHDVWTNGVR